MKIAKIRPDRVTVTGLAGALASNRATLSLLALLAIAITVYYQLASPQRIWILALPSGLLILNFVLALAIRGVLRNNWPLMVFHFALIALVLLAFAGRMSYFKATLELAENEEFAGQLENIRQGPWHAYSLAGERFTNLGFRIAYHRGIKRDKTLNRISLNSSGEPRFLEIGDHVPLVIGHYRFYTSHNKGFAPVFEWRPDGAAASVTGSVHLPAYPVHMHRQALEWNIPGTDTRIWSMLLIDENLLPEDREFDFRVPQKHRLVVRLEDRRYELRPGEALELPEGTLRYRTLSTWMGYKVDYDWTRPWLLASALIGLMGLFAHYLVRFDLVFSKRPPGPLQVDRIL